MSDLGPRLSFRYPLTPWTRTNRAASSYGPAMRGSESESSLLIHFRLMLTFVLYRKPMWRKERCQQRSKGDVRNVKLLESKKAMLRDFQKALETTTAMKRNKILRKICSNCAVSNLSLRGRCMSRSLHDAAEVVISRLLTRNCCGLAVVVSVIIFLSMMARWRSRRFTVVATLVVVSRSLPLWDLGGSNWDTRKS